MNPRHESDSLKADATNENENRQQHESLAGAFDDLVKSNLLLVKTIRDAIPAIQQSAPISRKWVVLVAACATVTSAMSTATFVTVKGIQAENRQLLAAFTEACQPSKDKTR